MKRKALFIPVFVLLAGFTLNAAEDAFKIAEKAEDAVRVKGSEFVATMIIINSRGDKRVRKIASITKLVNKGITEKKLIRFLSPADVKGTGLLTYDYKKKDDDMWLFMPALRKSRRIVSSEKSKSFMGSEFSYSDMSPPNLDDFHFKLLGEEKAAGELCWKIEMTPKNEDVADENGFSKKISYIAKKDNVIRKSVYYDLDGTLHKVLTVKSLKEIDKRNHKYRLTHMIMVNKQDGRKSILKVERIKFNPTVSNRFFTIGYLEKM